MQITTDERQKELKTHGSDSFPFLISFESILRYETNSFLWHWHPEIELTYVTAGTMDYSVNDSVYHLSAGQALFCNATALHSGQARDNQPCDYISITFDPALIYGSSGSLVYEKYVKPLVVNPAAASVCFTADQKWQQDAVRIILELVDLGRDKQAAFELDILRQLNRFWKLLYLNIDAGAEFSLADRKNFARIRRILSYIEKHYAEKITLGDIEQQVNICRNECCRIFKKHMNISIFDFILEYRIEQSLLLLLNTNQTITEISAQTGFNDSNYFTKVFRRLKGCSPRQYRKGADKSF